MLVVDDARQPRGWVDARRSPAGHPLGLADLVLGGSLVGPQSSLRTALDAALSSPSGRGVAIDADGRVIGTVAARDVLDAIETARLAAGAAAIGRPSPAATRSPAMRPGRRGGPVVNWNWLNRNTDQILSWLLAHLWLAALPTLLGLLLALPLGALAFRYRWSLRDPDHPGRAAVHDPVAGAVRRAARASSAPGSSIRSTWWSRSRCTRWRCWSGWSPTRWTRSPPLVRQSATAMGYRPIRSLITVQLPLAIPVIGAGLRVAAVSNVSLVSVAALLGVPQLGQLFLVGFQLDFYTPIIAGHRALPAGGRRLRHDHPGRRAGRHPMDQGGEPPMNGAFTWLTDRRELVGPRRCAGPVAASTSGTPSWRWRSRWSSRCRIGAAIGHTGRLTGLVSGLANALRALPTLGLLILLALWGLGTFKGSIALVGPAIAVLVILAIPPILSNTYAGIAAVDPAARDAAKGMGMTGREVLTKVELPVALPLIMSGIRSAFLQVVATATIAARGLARWVRPVRHRRRTRRRTTR